MFLAAQALLCTAPVLAQTADATSRNAVCVLLGSGDAKYVAFKENPVINSTDGKLVVTDMETKKQLLLADLSDVSSITAVYHDFTVTSIEGLSKDTGKEVKAVYDLSGKPVKEVLPGQVYILKFTDGSTVKAVK